MGQEITEVSDGSTSLLTPKKETQHASRKTKRLYGLEVNGDSRVAVAPRKPGYS